MRYRPPAFEETLRPFMVAALLALAPTAASAQDCIDPPEGAVAWWSGDNHAQDLVGNSNGRLKEGATFGGGQVSAAFDLDGNGSYVRVGNSSSLEIRDWPITVEGWVRLDSDQVARFFVSDHNSDTQPPPPDDPCDCYRGVLFGTHSSGVLELRFGDGSGSGGFGRRTKLGDTVLSLGVWHHVAAVIRGATDMTIYLAGVDDGGTYSGTGGAVAYSSEPALIGIAWEGGSKWMDGQIDELKVYDRELTQSEIQAIVDAGPDGQCKPVLPILAGVRGFEPATVTCRNLTTGQELTTTPPLGVTIFDCELAGLVVNPGDEVAVEVVGDSFN